MSMNSDWIYNKTQNLICILHTLIQKALTFDLHGNSQEVLGEYVSLHFRDEKIKHLFPVRL